ncbi:PAAR domain-containing protein [Klebsiella sp. BIGb0407]|uniref:PAAR domain-containing protein n=1 Tax=Klebsiella sp. BIGb0407 TaxID=2940603 RepID=UPI002166EE9A|nr:PAAR domain-containing protein [Klebsiella sp. BIGb0407]MCS3433966.1 putative Zn-binding protein involved in type VI secretion [Klebsiella sp. BIGb0407]
MTRALACLGDKTRYGEIITATASWFEEHKPIARTGDKASCSQCKGYFEILASAQDWLEEGKAYAATGDRVLCRCPDHYIYGSATQFIRTGLGSLTSRNTRQSSVPAQQGEDASPRNSIRFQCIGDDGQLLIHCRYTLIFPDDRSEAGITDGQGMTAWHLAESAEDINLHMLTD